MNPEELDKELERLLCETVDGLRKRIVSDDANASDFTAAIKLLTAAGTIDGIQEVKAKRGHDREYSRLLDSLPDFDEDGKTLPSLPQ